MKTIQRHMPFQADTVIAKAAQSPARTGFVNYFGHQCEGIHRGSPHPCGPANGKAPPPAKRLLVEGVKLRLVIEEYEQKILLQTHHFY